MILLIDNYDSFVYNLAHYIQHCGETVKVVRNDCITIADIQQMNPVAIVLSPGPCNPDTAGICLDVVKYLHSQYPILGVCLGHQTIGQVFGGTVKRAITPVHGKTENIHHNQQGVFTDIDSPTVVTRYHSLIVDMDGTEQSLQIDSQTQHGEVMAFSHKKYPVYGVQFHPEAILTQAGKKMIANFIDIAKKYVYKAQ